MRGPGTILKFGSNQILGFLPHQGRIWKPTAFVVEASMPSEALCHTAQVSPERSLWPSAPRSQRALIRSPFCGCAFSVRLCGSVKDMQRETNPCPGSQKTRNNKKNLIYENYRNPSVFTHWPSAWICSHQQRVTLLWLHTNFEAINVIELLNFTPNPWADRGRSIHLEHVTGAVLS